MNTPFIIFLAIIAMEYIGVDRHYLPFLKALPLIAVATLFLFVIMFFKYGVKEISDNKQTKLLLLFIFLTGLATLHGLISSYALQYFIQQIGYFILFFVAYHVIDDVMKIKTFMKMFVLFHSFMAIVNYDMYFAIVREGVFTAGYFLGDGNDFAWSMVISSGFGIYFFVEEKNFQKKLLYAIILLPVIYAILGTQSRGAVLALGASVLYYWLVVSKKKILGMMLIVCSVIAVISFAPSQYTHRLETIGSYQEDGSAMGRIKAWGTAVEMALDHPVLGVGAGSVNSAYGRLYRKASDPVRWISTHSIYFKTLAEYGFIGVSIYILLIYSTWKDNKLTSRKIIASKLTDNYSPLLPESINMSLCGYAVGGMFLGGINYPHLFLLISLTLRLKSLVNYESSQMSSNNKHELDDKYKYSDYYEAHNSGDLEFSHHD